MAVGQLVILAEASGIASSLVQDTLKCVVGELLLLLLLLLLFRLPRPAAR